MDNGIGLVLGSGVSVDLGLPNLSFFAYFGGNISFVVALDDDGGIVVSSTSSVTSSYMLGSIE